MRITLTNFVRHIGKIIFSFSLFIPRLIALAAEEVEPVRVRTSQDIVDIFDRIAKWFAGIFVILASIIMLYAGFLFLTSGESEEGLTKARRTFLWGLVGIAVALSAFGIVQFIKSLLTTNP